MYNYENQQKLNLNKLQFKIKNKKKQKITFFSLLKYKINLSDKKINNTSKQIPSTNTLNSIFIYEEKNIY